LPTTLTDDSAIAAAAMIGDSSKPNAGSSHKLRKAMVLFEKSRPS